MKKGDELKVVYVPGSNLPASTEDNAVYFVEGNKQIYVGDKPMVPTSLDDIDDGGLEQRVTNLENEGFEYFE